MVLENKDLSQDFIQLARTALSGRTQDVHLLIHRASKRYRDTIPHMSESLLSLLKESPSRASPLRKQNDVPLPVDLDSRLQLLRVEIAGVENEPIFSDKNKDYLQQVLMERKNADTLYRLGLHPTKSLLFTGAPGLGKTLAAKWIASQLNRPLLVLDLAAVMSSYLGRTGNNIRYVLDYAKSIECVLLLDELDAIAKRRDDTSEIGELKRLVTVLLQEIDDWPSSGLLLAATNHPNLLDPAVWRRFEMVVDFESPSPDQTQVLIKRLLMGQVENLDFWSQILSYALAGKSFSDVERQISILRKSAAIERTPILDGVKSLVASNINLSKEEKYKLVALLESRGVASQRQIQELTGVSRDTIRKLRREANNDIDKDETTDKKTATKLRSKVKK